MRPSEESVEALRFSSLNDEAPLVRRSAIEALGDIGLPLAFKATDALVAALKDPSSDLRESAANSLAKLGPSLCNADILKSLKLMLKDNLWKVRYSACGCIASYGDKAKDCLQELLKVLVHGTVLRTHVAMAIAALGEDGEKALIDILVQQSTTFGIQVRKSAAFGLGSIDLTRVPVSRIEAIIEKLFDVSSDSRPILRAAVLSALGALGRKANETITYVKAPSLLSFFYSFMKDKDKSVRETAAQLIARSGSSQAGELLLIEAAMKDSNSLIRTSAVHGLYWVGPRSVRTVLLALRDQEEFVRKVIILCILFYYFSYLEFFYYYF